VLKVTREAVAPKHREVPETLLLELLAHPSTRHLFLGSWRIRWPAIPFDLATSASTRTLRIDNNTIVLIQKRPQRQQITLYAFNVFMSNLKVIFQFLSVFLAGVIKKLQN
jgi:hypothetical protein